MRLNSFPRQQGLHQIGKIRVIFQVQNAQQFVHFLAVSGLNQHKSSTLSAIRIGARTNIQDGSVLHVMRDEWPLILGDDVTVGHSVTLHGCTIESRCLIGMGAVILNGVTIGAGSIVAAGTLITERTAIPAGSLVMGSPGRVKRVLTEIDKASIDAYAKRYVGYKNIYREEPTA